MRCKRFISLLLLLMLAVTILPAARRVEASNHRYTLVIDAGHGGHDVGAKGAISYEKNINLSVALAFGRLVEQNCPDVKVIYTRKTDVFIPLKTRANIANNAKADLFISVHTNALAGGKISRGFEVWTLGMHRAKDNLDVAMRENSVISMEEGYQTTYQGFDPRSSESYIMFEFMQDKNMARSVELAQMIERSVCQTAGRPDKGVHQAGFLVLRETSMPSCLIELGFITTPDEEQELNQDETVSGIAKGIYKAFLNYKGKYGGGFASPYKVSGKQVADNSTAIPNLTKGVTNVAIGTPVAKRQEKQKQNNQKQKNQKQKNQKKQSDDKSSSSSKPTKPTKPTSPTKSASTKKLPADAPIFKVQVMAGSVELKTTDPQFKGEKNVEKIKEGKYYKYFIGSSTDYNVINRLRKQLVAKFPEAYVVCYKQGKPYDVNQGIKEFKQNR